MRNVLYAWMFIFAMAVLSLNFGCTLFVGSPPPHVVYAPSEVLLPGLPHMGIGQNTTTTIILTLMFTSIPEGNSIFTFMAATGWPLWLSLENCAFLQGST